MFKNWKTTLVGFLGGVFAMVVEIALTGTLTWKGVGFAALSVAKGMLQKDYDATGTGKGASKAEDISNVPIAANPN